MSMTTMMVQDPETGAIVAVAKSPQDVVKQLRSKITPACRPCWWTPAQHRVFSCDTAEAAAVTVRVKQLQLLRRATLQYFFSSHQLQQILDVVDPGKNQEGHIRVLTTLFAVLTDIEHVPFSVLLGHESYDKDGNGFVEPAEIELLRKERYPWVILQERLGPANLFNAICPDGEYALDLRNKDAQVAAQQLVVLTAEGGENLKKTSFNGMPFDVGAKWLVSVPPLGIFCATYVTPPESASLALRLGLARRTLMPGHGRWKAVPRHLRNPAEDPWKCEAALGMESMMIGADGVLIVDPRPELEKPSLQALLGALRFKFKLKKRVARARETSGVPQIRQIDLAQAAQLDTIVALSLKAKRATKKVSAKKGDEGGADDELSIGAIAQMVEGETVASHDIAGTGTHG